MEKKLRLGVDVDGVVLDSVPLYRAAFEKRGFPVSDGKEHVWGFEEAHNAPTETVQEVLTEVAQLIDVPLIPGAQILNKIVDLPHIESPIHFVSSRSIKSWSRTTLALLRHFAFPFMLTCGLAKGWYCKTYELDFFVEDGPPHIEDIYFNSLTEIYVLNKPYNRRIFVPTNPRIRRVTNWDEILIDLQREGYREAVRVSKPPHNL